MIGKLVLSKQCVSASRYTAVTPDCEEKASSDDGDPSSTSIDNSGNLSTIVQPIVRKSSMLPVVLAMALTKPFLRYPSCCRYVLLVK